MFPQVAAKFFAQRANGPRNLGKKPQADGSPAAEAGAAKSGAAKPAISRRVAYQVKIGDKTHQVIVEPA